MTSAVKGLAGIFSPLYMAGKSLFGGGAKVSDPAAPPPPPNSPTLADASSAGTIAKPKSLVSTGTAHGLARKANTLKRTLLG